MINFINVADLVNPESGKTYRQENLEKTHNIALGSLVEDEAGIRAWVIHCGRDCDQTPLYWLHLDPRLLWFKNKMYGENGQSYWPFRGAEGGYSEGSLKVIQLPEHAYKILENEGWYSQENGWLECPWGSFDIEDF